MENTGVVLPPPQFSAPPPKKSVSVTIWILLVVALVLIGITVWHFFPAPGRTVSYGVENLGTPGTTRIVETTYPTVSPVITKFVVTQAPYNADATGKTDATAVFEQAIQDAYTNGGGTVFVPSGTYRFDGTLTLPEGVTLKGDWKEPSATDKSVGGAVLAIYNTDKTFITLAGGAGVDGLNFWYPDQSVSNVKVYPPSVGVANDGFTPDRNSMTVQNVNFVNSYVGTDWSWRKAVQSVYVYNAYGTPLSKGLYLLNIAQASRMNDITFSPLYWSQSGLPGAPSDSDATAYTEAHSTGIAFGPGSGSYNTNLTVDGYNIGIADDDSDANDDGLNVTPFIFGVKVTNANHALYVNSTGGDLHVTSGTLSATVGANPAAVYIDQKSSSGGSLFLDEIAFTSTGNAIDDPSDMNLNVMHSTFAAWSGYAVHADPPTGNTVLVAGSTFSASGQKDFSLGNKVAQAALTSNTITGTAGNAPTIDGNTAAAVVNANALSIPSTGVSGFQSIGFDGTALAAMTPDESTYAPAKTDPGSLFVVTDYGAKGDCAGDAALDMSKCTDDDTAAIQKAIDAAKAYGGGTVYFPASAAAPGSRSGYLVKGNLSVPSGVELAGPAENTPTYVDNTQTALVLVPPANSTTPVITLAANSGMRGLFLFQANLDAYAKTPFPYLIQSEGEHTYLINMRLAGYNGVDMGSSDSTGHLVLGVQGYAVNNLFKISKSTRGYIGNYQFDPGSWVSADGRSATHTILLSLPITPKNPPSDSAGCTSGSGPCSFDVNIDGPADVYKQGSGLILGSAKNELLTDVFSHAPHTAIQTVDDGGGPSFTLINFGTESYTAFDLEALDPKGAEIVSSSWHTLIQHGTGPKTGDPNGVYGYAGCKTRGNGPDTTPCKNEPGESYIVVGKGVSPSTPIRIFTMDNQQYNLVGWQIAGGDVIAQQFTTGDRGTALQEFANVTNGAKVSIIGGDFLYPFTSPQHLFTVDTNSHAALAGSLTQGFSNTGTVDTSFQSTASVPSQGGGKKKNK